ATAIPVTTATATVTAELIQAVVCNAIVVCVLRLSVGEPKLDAKASLGVQTVVYRAIRGGIGRAKCD
ncbi:hypothetical protein, partial [Roseibium alexandrii]|uniref:hypothetical protein n=1 Tax=Roseibium alexandrii TaxID=388408 RepID=UPI001AD8FA67